MKVCIERHHCGPFIGVIDNYFTCCGAFGAKEWDVRFGATRVLAIGLGSTFLLWCGHWYDPLGRFASWLEIEGWHGTRGMSYTVRSLEFHEDYRGILTGATVHCFTVAYCSLFFFGCAGLCTPMMRWSHNEIVLTSTCRHLTSQFFFQLAPYPNISIWDVGMIIQYVVVSPGWGATYDVRLV